MHGRIGHKITDHIGGYFAAQNARRGARPAPIWPACPQPLTEVRVTDRERQARMLAVMAAVDSVAQVKRRRQRAMPQVAKL